MSNDVDNNGHISDDDDKILVRHISDDDDDNSRDGTRTFQSGSWDPHVWSNWGPKHFGRVSKSW